MPRTDSESTQQPHENEAVLYRLEAPIPMPPGAVPAPSLDRLKLSTVVQLGRFLSVFFPPMCSHRRGLRGGFNYPVLVFKDRASMLVNPRVANSTQCSLPRLMDVAGEINEWLDSWANSIERAADVSPLWAIYLGLGEADVDLVATGIANRVALPEESVIILRDYQGRESGVRLPARAKLRLHTPPEEEKASRVVDIRREEDVRVGMTSGGDKVVIIGDSSVIPPSGELTVDPRTFHRGAILVPKQVQICNPRTSTQDEEE